MGEEAGYFFERQFARQVAESHSQRQTKAPSPEPRFETLGIRSQRQLRRRARSLFQESLGDRWLHPDRFAEEGRMLFGALQRVRSSSWRIAAARHACVIARSEILTKLPCRIHVG